MDGTRGTGGPVGGIPVEWTSFLRRGHLPMLERPEELARVLIWFWDRR